MTFPRFTALRDRRADIQHVSHGQNISSNLTPSYYPENMTESPDIVASFIPTTVAAGKTTRRVASERIRPHQRSVPLVEIRSYSLPKANPLARLIQKNIVEGKL
jgi:hypothetical protein